MTQYLVAIHHPDDYVPSLEDEAMHRDIDTLNEEMVLEAANLDDALAWGRKAVVACRAPVEVRPFFGAPDGSS